MHISLAGRIALVTGASSGIGASVARALARSGAYVAVCARRKARIDSVAADIREAGAQADGFELDVSDKDSVRRCFDAIEAKAGGIVDVVVNNAGIVAPTHEFGSYDRADWDRILSVNLDGIYHVGHTAAERLIKSRKGGSIINVVSTAAERVASGHAAYCVSKGAALQLTRVMAIDLIKHGIRVNALSPGLFRSEIMTAEVIASEPGQHAISQIPARRHAEPTEIDAIAVLLASDAASYCVGANFVVDGGQSIGLPGF